MIILDIVCVSETRLEIRDEFIEGSHRLISSNDKNAGTPATGVTILMNRRSTGQIKKNNCLYDRVMTVDLKFPRRTIRILAVYLPNSWNYDLNYFQIIFDDIERLSMKVLDKEYALVIVGDFILSLERDRRIIMVEFC